MGGSENLCSMEQGAFDLQDDTGGAMINIVVEYGRLLRPNSLYSPTQNAKLATIEPAYIITIY
jgi:hypothetical protein